MDAAEARRRETQREVRELTTRLREEGKDRKEIKRITRELKNKRRARPDGPRSRKWREKTFGERPRGQQDRRGGAQQREDRPWMGEDAEKNQKREEAARKHDLVIIPILWKRREEEANMVREAAQQLKNKFMKHRINTWIDQRSSLLPGQKYEYWESVGVNLRVEVGPSEARSQTICLSQARGPDGPRDKGAAQRWPDLGVGSPEALHKVFDLLRENGVKWLKQKEHEGCKACSQLAAEKAFTPATGGDGDDNKVVAVWQAPPRAGEKRRTAPVESQGTHVKFDDDDNDDDDSDGGNGEVAHTKKKKQQQQTKGTKTSGDNDKKQKQKKKTDESSDDDDDDDESSDDAAPPPVQPAKRRKTEAKPKAKVPRTSGDSLEANYALD